MANKRDNRNDNVNDDDNTYYIDRKYYRKNKKAKYLLWPG